MIAARYGTLRGFVRLRLAQIEAAFGLASVHVPDPDAVRRLVFVCHGNICRSAYAELIARKARLATASFGLSATSGKPAHGPAIAAAHEMGQDLRGHVATPSADYTPRHDDLLLAMESRQLRRIAADPRLAHLPRTLLGLYTRPRFAHLHDPYGLSDRYMIQCLRRIETAIPTLRVRFPGTASQA